MNTDLNNVSIWAAIFSLQQAVSFLYGELNAFDPNNLHDWGEILSEKLQHTVDQCVSDGLKEEAVSDAIDAGMPPMLAFIRRMLHQ